MIIPARVGKALILALCVAAVPACSGSGNSEEANANSSAIDSGIELNRKAEKEIRAAIEQSVAHGLKPELFLKDGDRGAALAQAALTYASALADGYSDPKKLHEVYTIPRPKTDVRAGLRQAVQNGTVGEWLNSLAPQTDEYRALSQAFLQYAKQASETGQHPIATDKPI